MRFGELDLASKLNYADLCTGDKIESLGGNIYEMKKCKLEVINLRGASWQ